MIFKKLIIYHIIKQFEFIEVTEESFNNSPNIEVLGLCDCIKIYSEYDKQFRLNELMRLNYNEVNN